VRPRTLLVLLILVLALGAFIRFYERDLPSSDERAQRAKKVLDFKKDQVTRVRLTTTGTGAAGGAGSAGGAGGTVVLERLPAAKTAKAAAAKLPDALAAPDATAEIGEWRLARPLAAPADAAAVDRLLDSLANLEKARTLDQVVPAEVGLDKPRATVALTLGGKPGSTGKPDHPSEIVLDIGAAVPTGGQAIVAIAGQPQAYVVSDSLLADVQKPPGDWRDRQMFHGNRDAVERLAWTVGGGPRVVLARRGDRFWLESPIADRADRDQVEKLLTDLSGLTAESFAAPPPAMPSPPRVVLEAVVAGQPQPFRVELGPSHPAPAPAAPAQPGAPPEPAGNLTLARVGDTVFETRSPLPETLSRPPADWRSPQLSGLEVHQVDAAVVRDDRGAVSLSRSGTDWKRGATTISYMPVSDLLFALTDAKADRLLSAAEAAASGVGGGGGGGAGAAKPAITVELRGGLAGNETLTLYPPLAGGGAAGAAHGVPARASGRDTVLLLPESKLKEIQDRLAAVRAAPPLAPEKPAKK
jgi:hypothetical protein